MKYQNRISFCKRRSSNAFLVLACIIGALFYLLIGACVNVQYPVQKSYLITDYVTENKTQVINETVPVTSSKSQEVTVTPYIIWSNPQLRFKENHSIWYYGYHLPEPAEGEKTYLKITFFRQRYYQDISASVFDMSPRGQILAPPLLLASDNTSIKLPALNWITSKEDVSTLSTWMNVANLKLDFAHFLGGKTNLFLNSEDASPLELDMRDCTDVALLISGTKDPQNCRFATSVVRIVTITDNINRAAESPITVQTENKHVEQKTVMETRQVPFWESFFPK
jgi:hypothetical protein